MHLFNYRGIMQPHLMSLAAACGASLCQRHRRPPWSQPLLTSSVRPAPRPVPSRPPAARRTPPRGTRPPSPAQPRPREVPMPTPAALNQASACYGRPLHGTSEVPRNVPSRDLAGSQRHLLHGTSTVPGGTPSAGPQRFPAADPPRDLNSSRRRPLPGTSTVPGGVLPPGAPVSRDRPGRPRNP
jgi:hypothetical protein